MFGPGNFSTRIDAVAHGALPHQDLAAAAADLAGAMRGISLDRWARFLRDVAARAEADTGRVMLAQATHPNTATDAGPAASPSPGRYVADNPRQWIGQPSVGSGECVPLVRAAIGAPRSAEWRRGDLVQGNTGYLRTDRPDDRYKK